MKATLLASYRRRERSGYRDYSLKLDGSTILHLLHELVGGIPTPLKNMSSSVGMIIPNIWKNNKCSKPPTR